MRPQLVKKAVQFGEWEMAALLTWDWDTKVYYLRQIGGLRSFCLITQASFDRTYSTLKSDIFDHILWN